MSAEPFTAFAFAVELRLPGSDRPLCEAAFCACDGLELRREVIRARDGADPTNVRLLPGPESFGNVVLRRGMTTTFDLWDWWERVRRGQAARATCDIVVLSPDLAQERVRFRLYRCLPVKLTGPALNAAGNDIAIESLELACEGIDIVRPGDKPSAAPARRARRQGPAARARRELRARDQQGRAGSRCRSTPTSCGRRSATSSARRRAWTCGSPSTSTRRRPEAAARPTTSAA